jgi:hypothetical protein
MLKERVALSWTSISLPNVEILPADSDPLN